MLSANEVDCGETQFAESEVISVTPEEFVRHLTSHAPVERVGGLPGNLVGARDCLSGILYVVNLSDLARNQANLLRSPDAPVAELNISEEVQA